MDVEAAAASPANPAQSAEITRLSNQLSDRVIAALRMDQQATLRKYQSEQLRVKEVSLIKQKLKAAGIILTREQETQVDAVYARKSRLRTLAIIEAKGESYDKNITILNKQTTQRVVQLLNPTQIAVLSSANKPKTSLTAEIQFHRSHRTDLISRQRIGNPIHEVVQRLLVRSYVDSKPAYGASLPQTRRSGPATLRSSRAYTLAALRPTRYAAESLTQVRPASMDRITAWKSGEFTPRASDPDFQNDRQ